jgi:hypothetical protein
MDFQQVQRQERARVGNLVRSLKWRVFHSDQYLLNEADKEVKKLKEQEKRILCIWDDSVLEKPESNKIEGLCLMLTPFLGAFSLPMCRPFERWRPLDGGRLPKKVRDDSY